MRNAARPPARSPARSQVPDVFQIIVKEKGVFTNVTSPSTKAKLRLLFEVAPLALLVEKVRPGCSPRRMPRSSRAPRLLPLDHTSSWLFCCSPWPLVPHLCSACSAQVCHC